MKICLQNWKNTYKIRYVDFSPRFMLKSVSHFSASKISRVNIYYSVVILLFCPHFLYLQWMIIDLPAKGIHVPFSLGDAWSIRPEHFSSVPWMASEERTGARSFTLVLCFYIPNILLPIIGLCMWILLVTETGMAHSQPVWLQTVFPIQSKKT